MTVIGATVWMGAVFLGLYCLLGEEKRRVAEYEGLVLLLRHIHTSVSAYGLPKEQIFAAFSHPALERCGFLAVLKEKGLPHALEKGGLCVAQTALHPLYIFAEGMGMRLSKEELSACRLALDEAVQILSSLRERLPTRLRLCRTLVLTGGMMVILLLV